MKRFFLSILLMLSFMLQVNAQSMTDDQVLKEAVSAKKQGLSETDIASRLLKKGATMAQIQKLRRQYASQITKQGLDSNVDNAISNVQDRMRTNRESNDNGIVTHEGEEAPQYVAPVEPETTTGKKVFGRDIFNNKALTFEPQMNIATPQNYVVGPGDQIIIDVYGDTQKSEQLQVSPDGNVVVPDYGPIRVSGLSVAQAQQRIRSALGIDREAFAPTGRAMVFDIPAVAAPWKGAQGAQGLRERPSGLRPFDELRDRRGGGMFCSLRFARA